MKPTITATALSLALALPACSSQAPAGGTGVGDAHVSAGVRVPKPLSQGDPYELAADFDLPSADPMESEGLHNVFQLSEHVYAGSEPHGRVALAKLAAMGIKTILSVDGKTPDAKTAAALGMRYVHVPIKYRGISPAALVRIAKTFRELPPPFYVHCFHGKHRGPAGAAVGCLVLDGAPRQQILAEMRQWCGTSGKYQGLYRDIAQTPMPNAATTAALQWGFPSAHPLKGFRHAMIAAPRAFDHLKALDTRNWEADPQHPDIDAVNEADKLHGLFARSAGLEEILQGPADKREWVNQSVTASRNLRDALQAIPSEGDAARERARGLMKEVKHLCTACHTKYRNQ